MGSYLEWGYTIYPSGANAALSRQIIPWLVGPASTHFALEISGTLTLKNASANGLS